MQMVNRSPLLRYSIAIASVLLATLLRFLLNPLLENSAPFVTYILAALITAWACGLGPALLAICLGAMGGVFFFVPPQTSLSISGPANMIGLVLYLSISIVATFLSQELHRARRRAERNARI